MAKIHDRVFFGDKITQLDRAQLSVASSAVLYGLSVYTVFPITKNSQNNLLAFRIEDHFQRLIESARIIGIDDFEKNWNFSKFKNAVDELCEANKLDESVFVRATVHVNELVPGTKSRGLKTILSIFLYEATPILPAAGARLKTSVWRRIPDYAIPSRAKVNGAYVNSVLAKQDAIDSGYDDCIFLDAQGHVCELSAANIFMVRNGELVTPDNTNDLLEGITRRTVLQLARDNGLTVRERSLDLTELYVADEVFACGTSANLTVITEIDARKIGNGERPVTRNLQKLYKQVLNGGNDHYLAWTTSVSSPQK